MGAQEYIVYRRLLKGEWEQLKTVSASTTSYKDTKAESGKSYYYTVRAAADGYRSAYQNYERDVQEPSLSALVALADFFDISLDELVCRQR